MRFFFNLAGAIYDPDNIGHELSGLSEARLLAATCAAEMLGSRPEIVWLGEELRVEVTNSDRLLLFTVIVLGIDAPAGMGKV